MTKVVISAGVTPAKYLLLLVPQRIHEAMPKTLSLRIQLAFLYMFVEMRFSGNVPGVECDRFHTKTGRLLRNEVVC